MIDCLCLLLEFGYEATGGMVSGGWLAALELCVQEEEDKLMCWEWNQWI